MIRVDGFKIFGTAVDDSRSIQLDEITIVASPETIRGIGVFLLNVAYEMETNDVEHIHLQDVIENFSYDDHVDVIPHIDKSPPK